LRGNAAALPEFETMSKQFDRDITEKENRETLWSFFFKLEDLTQTITDIRRGEQNAPYGADWVYKKRAHSLPSTRTVPKMLLIASATHSNRR
jgi:hypothetical protein